MKESMEEIFSKLEERIFDSISKTDLKEIENILKSIKDPTLTTGVGGSNVVSNFLSKVLSIKNNIICEDTTFRDLLYRNLECYKNIIICSYSGKNYGVDISFDNKLTKYLLSRNTRSDAINIKYEVTNMERSFISLSSTLIPMTLLLIYYCHDINLIKEILSSEEEFILNDSNIYEVLTGYETSTASTFIESTMMESGIGIPIIHDKYSYCHGRSTFSYHNDSNLIIFDCGKEIDKLYIEEAKKYYKNVIVIKSKYKDPIINDYYFTYMSMLLCKKIALKKEKDLANVEYSPFVKKLYYFKGEM